MISKLRAHYYTAALEPLLRTADPLEELIGQSPKIAALRGEVRRLLERQKGLSRLPPVLILGETGAGKGVLARLLHAASARAGQPFVAINCAALPEALLESELFGFERGAFTDAQRSKAGLFQTAHRGTLFLDEVGALALGLQAKLLTAIEDRAIRRLGSTQTEPVDIRILSATSEDLSVAIRERRFRSDLFHRLSAITLSLPPLRERSSDIIILAEHFLATICREYGIPVKRLTEEAKVALRGYAWPGNVREIANLMERMTVLIDEPTITAAHLGLLPHSEMPAVCAETHDAARPLRDTVGEFERVQLLAALNASAGNVSRAALLLGIPRNTLRYRLAKYGLGPEAPAISKASRPPEIAAVERIPGAPRDEAPQALEERLLSFLVVALGISSGSSFAPRATDQVGITREKVTTFGGHIEVLSATHVVAVFGVQLADAAANAVHAALAIQHAVRMESHDGPTSIPGFLVYGARCLVDRSGGDYTLEPASRERVLRELGDVRLTLEPDTIVVSPSIVPSLESRFAFTSGSERDTTPPLARLISRPPIVAGKPSIAVMPFQNLTGEPDQEHLGDAITEDMIAALSRFRWLFVIARSSTLIFKTRPNDIAHISGELGVRYVLTGTVRKNADQLRVTAELVDAEVGNTVWADHYDGSLREIFDFQDKMIARIASTLDSRVRVAEIQRALRKHPDRLDAYECVQRGLSLTHRLFTPDFVRAADLLERAVELDPNFAAAYAWRSWWYLLKIGEGLSTDTDADIQYANHFAEAALERDPDDPIALAVSGHAASLHHEYEKALRRFERAVALNPNLAFAWGLSAATFCYVGESAVALDRALYAMRLSPFDLFAFYFEGIAGMAEMLAGRYEEAVSWALKSRAEKPRYSANLRKLAACLAHLGRLEEARAVGREFLALQTSFTLSGFRKHYPLRDKAALDVYVSGLRKAGLPE